MPQTWKIRNDGQAWYDVPDDEFQKLVADPAKDCWVDLSIGTMIYHCTRDAVRRARRELEQHPVGTGALPRKGHRKNWQLHIRLTTKERIMLRFICSVIVTPFWMFFELTGIPIVPAWLDPDYQDAVAQHEQAVADYDARHSPKK